MPAPACCTACTGPASDWRKETVRRAREAMIKTTNTARRQTTLLRGILTSGSRLLEDDVLPPEPEGRV